MIYYKIICLYDNIKLIDSLINQLIKTQIILDVFKTDKLELMNII